MSILLIKWIYFILRCGEYFIWLLLIITIIYHFILAL